jgi:hypothetical protein
MSRVSLAFCSDKLLNPPAGLQRWIYGQDTYQLEKFQTILNEKPEAANHVRFLCLVLQEKNEWLFTNSTFIRILDLIAKSLSTLHKLELDGVAKNPVLLMSVLAKSFFSQSLHLSGCKNPPLPLLLICPRLQGGTRFYCGTAMHAVGTMQGRNLPINGFRTYHQ